MKFFTPKIVRNFLIGAIAVLLVLHIISFIHFYINELSTREFFFRKFNFAQEKNVPSIYSSLLFLISAILLFRIGLSPLRIKKSKFFWIGMSILFLYLGFDELLRLHEGISRNYLSSMELGGFFYYEWVIAYGIALILIGILLLKPFLKLPVDYQKKFILSGIVFLSGAMGFEMISGWYTDKYLIAPEAINTNLTLVTLYTIEELLEMLGISLFIFYLFQFNKEFTYVKK